MTDLSLFGFILVGLKAAVVVIVFFATLAVAVFIVGAVFASIGLAFERAEARAYAARDAEREASSLDVTLGKHDQ